MKIRSIPQMRPLFGDLEKQELNDYLKEDGFFTEYKRTEKFEIQLAEFIGSKHCIVVNNGTISLTLAALALGIGHGDEVIVPNYTMIATPNSVKMLGARPVFVDVEEQTLVLDVEKVRDSITNKTKAIILVSANGRAPNSNIQSFVDLSNEFNIPLIEDAAQSLGSFYPNGMHIGRAGVIGSFSFSAPKIISTGQGGAIVTDSDELAIKIRKLKDFGRSSGGNDIHDTIGFNFKFTELQACVGIAQMKQLEERIIRKKEIWSRYRKNLNNINGIKLFEHDIKYCAPWFIDSLVDNRSELIEFLRENEIQTRTMYPPINTQKAYSQNGSYPVSEKVGEKGLWLPSMVQITNNEIDHITKLIKKFYTR